MPTVNQVAIKILVDGKEMEASLGEFNQLTKRAGASGTTAGNKISSGFNLAKIGILAAAGAITGIIIGLNKAVNAASDFTEANNKLLTIFKNIPDAARAARDELVNAYHMSYREAAQLLGATGDILTGLGMEQKAALDLSSQVTKLAADITSFSNAQGGAEAVAHALTSGLLGEREALKTYGIVIDEVMVKEALRAEGLEELTGLALKQAKAEVTLTLALAQSKNAIGDTARTANDYASVQRQVAAQMENMSMQLGAVFIPIWNKVLKGFLDLLKIIGEENIAGILMATWEVLKDFAIRSFDLISGIITALIGLMTKDYAAATAGMQQVYTAVAEGWEATFERVSAAYVQGGEDYKAFLEGSLNALAEKEAAQDELQAEIDEERLAKNKEYWDAITSNVKKYDGDLNKIYADEVKLRAKMAMDELKLEDTKNKLKIKINQESLAAMSSIFGSLFGKSKAAAYAQAIINTWLGVSKVIGQTGIASPFAIPAILASGFAAAAQISATKYALGGEISSPTLALAGEAGPEVVAPRKTFIDVANQMIRGGEIGGGSSSKVFDKLADVEEAIRGIESRVEITPSELSFIIDSGNRENAEIDF